VQTLQLVFRNEEGTLYTLSLANPRQDLEPLDVGIVMDALIDKNIFHTAGGAVAEKVRARLVTREMEEIVSYI